MLIIERVRQVRWNVIARRKKQKMLKARLEKIREYLDEHSVRKLQVGCGKNKLLGWLNTDLEPRDSDIVYLSATEPFPFEGSTFHYVFNEHIIEHIRYEEGLSFLRECMRILKPGGKLRTATPDLRFLIELYNPVKTELQESYISFAMNAFLPDIGTHEDVFVINNFFRGFGHQFIYDDKTLRDAYAKSGFVAIARFPLGESEDVHLRGLESHGNEETREFVKLETFILEGTKPS